MSQCLWSGVIFLLSHILLRLPVVFDWEHSTLETGGPAVCLWVPSSSRSLGVYAPGHHLFKTEHFFGIAYPVSRDWVDKRWIMQFCCVISHLQRQPGEQWKESDFQIPGLTTYQYRTSVYLSLNKWRNSDMSPLGSPSDPSSLIPVCGGNWYHPQRAQWRMRGLKLQPSMGARAAGFTLTGRLLSSLTSRGAEI